MKSDWVDMIITDYPNAQKAAIYGIQDLLAIANRLRAQCDGDQPEFRVRVISEFDNCPPVNSINTFVFLPPILSQKVPGKACPRLIQWIRGMHKAGAVVGAACAGTFLLAEAGLLDGKEATTHWFLNDLFKTRFQSINLNTDKMIVDLGDIMTSGGIMSWIDLGLQIVDRYHGPEIRIDTARYFVVDAAPKVQSSYRRFYPIAGHGDEQILTVQKALAGLLQENHNLDDLAAMAGISRFSFAKRFRKCTGHPPMEYLSKLRLDKARHFLERSQMNIDSIAYEVGYKESSSLRRNFRKEFGVSPKEYRKRFQVSPGA